MKLIITTWLFRTSILSNFFFFVFQLWGCRTVIYTFQEIAFKCSTIFLNRSPIIGNVYSWFPWVSTWHTKHHLRILIQCAEFVKQNCYISLPRHFPFLRPQKNSLVRILYVGQEAGAGRDLLQKQGERQKMIIAAGTAIMKGDRPRPDAQERGPPYCFFYQG